MYRCKMTSQLRKTKMRSKCFRKPRSLRASDLKCSQISELTSLTFGLIKRMKNRLDLLEQQLFLLEDMQIDFQVVQAVSPIEPTGAPTGLVSSSPLRKNPVH